MTDMNSASKFYYNNRDKVLDYKKQFYFEKTKYIKQFKNLRFISHSKSATNIKIKEALDKNNDSDKILILIDKNDPISYTDFYDKYTIKNNGLSKKHIDNFSEITIDWGYTYIHNGERTYAKDKICNENGSHTLLLIIPSCFLENK